MQEAPQKGEVIAASFPLRIDSYSIKAFQVSINKKPPPIWRGFFEK
jgi:hypothetical protein